MKFPRYKVARACTVALAATFLGACGGSSGGGPPGNGGGNGGAPPPPPPPPEDPYQPPPGDPLIATLPSIQAHIFTPICTACHAGAAAPEGLMLDAANSYGLLVDVPSVQAPDLMRVEPGNPDDSYLIQKLEGTAAVGARMPEGGPPLPQSDINVIRQWITEGAQQGSSSSMMAVRALGSSIVPDSEIEALPERIVIMFDRELDASTVHYGSVRLQRSGVDGAFDSGTAVDIPIASISVPLANPRSIHVAPAGTQHGDASYRLVLTGTGPTPVLDLAGNRLDGDWVRSFPSGDGREGGDLKLTFTVRGTAQ